MGASGVAPSMPEAYSEDPRFVVVSELAKPAHVAAPASVAPSRPVASPVCTDWDWALVPIPMITVRAAAANRPDRAAVLIPRRMVCCQVRTELVTASAVPSMMASVMPRPGGLPD